MRIAFLTTDSREHFKDYNNQQPYFGSAPEALLEGFKLLPDEVEIHVVSCFQRLPVSSPQKLADNIFYHALHVPKWGWMRSAYFGCSRAVRRKLREIQPNIVHGQGTERDCAISAVRSGFPNVLTIHGNMHLVAKFIRARPFSYYWLATKWETYCLRRTLGVVAISSYTQANVEGLTRKTWLLPNAVHPSFFETLRNPVSPPRLLCVANINSWKNQISLIRSLDVAFSHPNFELRFLGAANDADPYVQEFRAMVAERLWCHFSGFANRDLLQKELAAATFLILPSLEDNCPMVILEAAAAGVPAAASRIGGIPDLISEGETGVLFDPHNLEELGEAIRDMLANLGETAAMGARARAISHERFSPLKIAREHLEIYREVISQA